MTRRLVPLKHIAGINERSLGEATDPDYSFRYVDIGTAGRGELVAEPQAMRFEDAPSRARRLVRPGDTIVSTVRTYLRAVWPVADGADDLVVSTGFAVLTPRGVDPQFFCWWVRSDPFIEEVVARSVGVSYPAINAVELGQLKVSLPSSGEQRAIADFLDTETVRIDALIAKKRRLATLLWSRLDASVSQATRAHLTVGANDGAEEVPPGWRRLKLSRCFGQVDYGIGENSKDDGEIAVLGMGNIADRGAVVPPPNGYVDYVEPQMLLTLGDLLFNRTNSLTKVGKVALIETLAGPTTFASYLVRLRVSSLAEERYLRHFLNSRELLGLARSSALPSIGQANLNPARYGGLDVVMPPVEDQRAIADRLDQQMHRTAVTVARLDAQIALLQEHRQAFITAAVTGELEVPGVAA